VSENRISHEIVDHNIVGDEYVTYIVDLWQGDRNDPSTHVERYIGTWRADALETEERGAFDPDFTFPELSRHDTANISIYYFRSGNVRPLQWDNLETVQKADEDVLQHRRAHEQLTDQNGHVPYAWRMSGVTATYEGFLNAIDRVSENEEDEEAWDIIDNWRLRQMPEAERG
jgi:hypothetical protein